MPFPLVASILVCLQLLLPAAAMAQRSLVEGFGRMELQSADKKHGYARVRFPDGKIAERFTLRAGDCPKTTGDCRADRERIEFFDRSDAIRPGSEVWYAWSVYLPPDFPQPRQGGPFFTLGQIHQRGTSGPEALFTYFDDGYRIRLTDPTRLDDDPMRPLPDFHRVRLLPTQAMLGRWTRVMMNARWSRGRDGFLHVWINGAPAWSYSGPTTNANDGLYFKYGLYRSFVSRCGGPCPQAVAYYRDVRQGRSRSEVE